MLRFSISWHQSFISNQDWPSPAFPSGTFPNWSPEEHMSVKMTGNSWVTVSQRTKEHWLHIHWLCFSLKVVLARCTKGLFFLEERTLTPKIRHVFKCAWPCYGLLCFCSFSVCYVSISPCPHSQLASSFAPWWGQSVSEDSQALL